MTAVRPRHLQYLRLAYIFTIAIFLTAYLDKLALNHNVKINETLNANASRQVHAGWRWRGRWRELAPNLPGLVTYCLRTPASTPPSTACPVSVHRRIRVLMRVHPCIKQISLNGTESCK